MSMEQATKAASDLARKFISLEDTKGWNWELGRATPDAMRTETFGKTPRHWISLVRYSLDDSIIDGPESIEIDLLTDDVKWS